MLNQFKKILNEVSLVRVEIYEYLLFRERLLYIVRNAVSANRKVFFLLNAKAITNIPLSEIEEVLFEEKFSSSRILLFGNQISILKMKETQSKWKAKFIACLSLLYKWMRFILKKCVNFFFKILNLRNFIYQYLKSKNIQFNTGIPQIFNSAGPLAIFYTGRIDSKYWQAFFILIEEIKKRKLDYLCIVDDSLTYSFLLCKQINCYLVKPEQGSVTFNNAVFDKPRGAKKRFVGYAPLRAQMFNNLRRLCQNLNIKKAILLPHWSNLGSLVLSLKREQEENIKLVSFPVVTVNNNQASIIGWEEIDEIYCYGRQCVSAFRNMLYSEEKLKLCGNILMDIPLNKLKKKQEKLILIATSRLDINENLWIKEVVQYARANGYKCIIKVHPSFSYGDYSSLKAYDSNLNIITYIKDLYDLIERCELCITDCSTVGAEAVILDKMLLVVNLTGKKFNANPYEEFGVALEANTLQEVTLLLNKILNDSVTKAKLKANYTSFYEQYNYLNDGKAVERFVDGVLN